MFQLEAKLECQFSCSCSFRADGDVEIQEQEQNDTCLPPLLTPTPSSVLDAPPKPHPHAQRTSAYFFSVVTFEAGTLVSDTESAIPVPGPGLRLYPETARWTGTLVLSLTAESRKRPADRSLSGTWRSRSGRRSRAWSWRGMSVVRAFPELPPAQLGCAVLCSGLKLDFVAKTPHSPLDSRRNESGAATSDKSVSHR